MIKTYTTGIFMTNTYLVINENMDAIVIDPTLNFSEYANEIKEQYNVVAVLLTHGHVDHIDGIRYFDVPIYIHKDEKVILNDDSYNLYKMLGKASNLNFNNIIYLNDDDVINLIGYEIKVIHTPGHTRGSVCYLFDDKILFSGDTMFYHSVGRSDFPSGDLLKLRSSIKKLLKLNNNIVVYPGHEQKTSIREEAKYNPYR